MTNNLWEIIKFEDLIFLLKNAEKKFIVLSIITNETTDVVKKLIKKVLKEKSKIYPKVTFLLYKAKSQDFGKLQPMFNNDTTQYPKLYHIWNTQEILTGVISIDNKEIIENSFEDFHEVYMQGKLPNNENESEDNNKQNFQQKNIPPPMPPTRDPALEKKKMAEKLHLLRQKQEECTLEFLSEFKRRKEEEEECADKNKEKKKKTK